MRSPANPVTVSAPGRWTASCAEDRDVSLKVTVPVGTPEPGATTETFATRVTGCPEMLWLGDASRTVVVGAARTVCDSAPDVDPVKFELPS